MGSQSSCAVSGCFCVIQTNEEDAISSTLTASKEWMEQTLSPLSHPTPPDALFVIGSISQRNYGSQMVPPFHRQRLTYEMLRMGASVGNTKPSGVREKMGEARVRERTLALQRNVIRFPFVNKQAAEDDNGGNFDGTCQKKKSRVKVLSKKYRLRVAVKIWWGRILCAGMGQGRVGI